MSLQIFKELEQGTPEWLAARCGILTASVIGKMIGTRTLGAIEYPCPECETPAFTACVSKVNGAPIKTLHSPRATVAAEANIKVLEVSTGDMARTLTNTLVAERITGHVEPIQESKAMLRGTLDEPYARAHYAEHYEPVTEIGFAVRTINGHKLGYSPDGLVGDDGLIEIKSRDQRIQLQAFLDDAVPIANMAQMQTGMFVMDRKWCDYVSWSGGMPAFVKRVHPDERWFAAITDALYAFETAAEDIISRYLTAAANLPPTERIEHFADMEF